MKKTLLIILSCTILFSGCNLFFNNDDRNLKTINTNPDDYIYLIKYNKSNQIIKKNKTGSIASNVISELNNLNTTDFFDIQYNKVKNLMISNSSRAADSFVAEKKSDMNILNYTKDLSTEQFWTITGKDTKNNYQFNKRNSFCRYEGTYCYVFSDDENSSASSINKGINLETIDENNKNPYEIIGEIFDSIYEKETSVLGDATYDEYYSYYASCTNKIIIFVSDLCGNTHPDQKDGTVGLFNPQDLYSEEFQPSNNKNGNNHLRIFYVDAYYLTKTPKIVYSTLVHEFNHMINYIQKTLKPTTADGKTYFYDTWYTEMLSMVAEDMFQHFIGINDSASPKGRLPDFNVYYNYGFKLWKENIINPSIIYANTYAFGAFLARNFGGVNLISSIAKNSYVNEPSITKALKECYDNTIDFNYALEKFHLCLLNTKIIPDSMKDLKLEEQYYSLNRGSKTRNDIYFDPIDISSLKVLNQNNEILTISPKIYKKNESVDLYPYGFSIHYIGTGLNSFTIDITDKESTIDMLIATR